MAVDGDAGTHPARAMWQRYETLHAVVYFAPEVAEAMVRVGLKGFWMGYFGGRAAPMGPVGPELVTATFYNFHPSMPARAIPDAWSFATPAAVLEARTAAVGAALRRLLGDEVDGPAVAEAAELAARAAGACSPQGRPLFAAHLGLPWPEEPHLRLWHAATLLREHRGDGHVAALLTAGLGGLEAHVVLVAAGVVDAEQMRRARGWSEDDWASAERGLVDRGLLEPSGGLTEEGRPAPAGGRGGHGPPRDGAVGPPGRRGDRAAPRVARPPGPPDRRLRRAAVPEPDGPDPAGVSCVR